MNKLFTRKAENINELTRRTGADRDKHIAVIEKTIILTDENYKDFASDLFEDRDFIKENIDLMYQDRENKWHCILVTTADKKSGILVESEGYEYARYAARWNS